MREVEVQQDAWWPTPILHVKNKDPKAFNARLTEIVLEMEEEIVRTTKPTFIAGMTSGINTHWLEYNVFDWDYPEIRELRTLILNGIREFLIMVGEDPDSDENRIVGISAWATGLRYGEWQEVHHHDPAMISGHYMVNSGYPEDYAFPSRDEGSTVYFRPGFLDRSQGNGQRGTISPWDEAWKLTRRATPGNLVLFPSYVRHEVRPYLGDKVRISIAVDVYLKKQKAPIYFGKPRWFVP